MQYSIGNGVAKELTCETLDKNKAGGLPEGVWGGMLGGGGQRGKKSGQL